MFLIYFKTTRVLSTFEDVRVNRVNFNTSSSFESSFSFEIDSYSSREFEENDERVEYNKELKKNAKLENDEQFESKNKLVNNEFLALL
jgi:hypothetical protein